MVLANLEVIQEVNVVAVVLMLVKLVLGAKQWS